MYLTNKKRWKKLILSYTDTKVYYRIIQVLTLFIIFSSIVYILLNIRSIEKIETIKNLLYGEWDEVFINVNKKDLSYFQEHAFINDYSIQSIQEREILKDGTKVIIGETDRNFFDLGHIDIISGSLPQKDGEVAIEEKFLPMIGVKNIGDRISENSNIKSLIGYKLCGIIENYSSRWSLVNWDVKYINCFIKNRGSIETQVFTKFSSNLNRNDIEINMVNYRHNINYIEKQYLIKLSKLWIVVILIIIILIFKIYNLVNMRINRKKRYKNTNIWCKSNFIRKIIFIIISSYCILQLNELTKYMINNDYWFQNYQYSTSINDFIQKNKKDMISLFFDSQNSVYIKTIKSNNEDNLILLIFPEKYYTSLLDIVIICLWFSLGNFILLSLICYTLKTDKKLTLKYYYFGNNLTKYYRKNILAFVLFEFFLIILNNIIREFEHLNKVLLFKVILIHLTINAVRLIINYFIITYRMRNLETNEYFLLDIK